MKLFGIIFGAILAAAAVIWGVWSYGVSMEKAAASDLSMLETMTRGSKSAAELAVEFGKVQEVTLSYTLDGARDFERILRERHVDHMKAWSFAFDYVSNYREVVKIVREKIPEHRKWADEMEALLSKVELAARSP